MPYLFAFLLKYVGGEVIVHTLLKRDPPACPGNTNTLKNVLVPLFTACNFSVSSQIFFYFFSMTTCPKGRPFRVRINQPKSFEQKKFREKGRLGGGN